MHAQWLYRPPTWHPRPRRLLPLIKHQPGTIALSSAGYEIGDGNDPATMSVLTSETMNVAVYPIDQWPLTSATVTVTSDITDANGRLSDITDTALTIGVNYRVVIYHPASGEVWITTITAT